MFQYDCPECGAKVKLKQEAPAGKSIRCPVCQATFPAGRPAAAKPTAPAPAPTPAARPARPNIVEDDEEDGVTPYGVIRESEEEQRLLEKNKPKFENVRDKFKRSARGPAQALLVLPTNLLVAEGALTSIFGVLLIIIGVWPLIFTDVPSSDEEVAEALVTIFGGIVAFTWGALICLGASKMQNLESYAWALVGAVIGIVPLLAGIFALVTLRDPRVIAGFEEMEGAVDDEEEDDEDEEE